VQDQIVLLRVQMPEMDGLTATSILRERERGGDTHVAVIALIAHAIKGDQDPACLQEWMAISSTQRPAIALVTQQQFPNPSPASPDSSPQNHPRTPQPRNALLCLE
jgi:CheY-like chemotaxis protein